MYNFYLETFPWIFSNVMLAFFKGLCTEGLYRVSGNKTDQDNIQKQFDQGNGKLISNNFQWSWKIAPLVTCITS